jgi:methionine biosynthesis protein MetW
MDHTQPRDLAELNLTPTSDAAVLDRIARNAAGERLDHLFIVDVIEPGSRVLDLGCGRGTLLQMLVDRKDARGTGVEISEEKVYHAVGKGLSVYHGDIDEGLSYYPDAMFDYVILSQTLQEARETIFVMHEALRVGRYLIASFPNFGHWRARLQLLLSGRAPVTPALPYEWYDTPNIHSLTVRDFEEFSRQQGMRQVHRFFVGRHRAVRFWPNLFAEHGVYVLEPATPSSAIPADASNREPGDSASDAGQIE